MFGSAKLNNYLDLMERRGIPPAAILAGTRINQKQLADPAFKAGMSQSQKIIENMLMTSGNDSLGFDIGREITIADMGLVGHAMLASPTYREVINLWVNYASLIYGTMIQIAIREDLKTWSMLMTECLPAGPSYRFCMEEYLMLVLKLNDKLRGYPCDYHSISLIYPRPANYRQYEFLFNCPVTFDGPQNRITVKRPALDESVQTRNQYLHQVYLDYCEKLAEGVMKYQPLTEKVLQHIVQHLGKEVTIKSVAKRVGCSESTLRRGLLAEGTSFRELLTRFRTEFAMDYLKSTRMSAKQVGYLLGYRDSKAFLRSFKQWTGKTVGEYRKPF
jgi:AraC-like DNA-binding protein